MNGRGVGCVRGSRQEVGTRRDVLDALGVFGVVEGTQLIGDGGGRVGVTAPVEAKMAKHVAGGLVQG